MEDTTVKRILALAVLVLSMSGLAVGSASAAACVHASITANGMNQTIDQCTP